MKESLKTGTVMGMEFLSLTISRFIMETGSMTRYKDKGKLETVQLLIRKNQSFAIIALWEDGFHIVGNLKIQSSRDQGLFTFKEGRNLLAILQEGVLMGLELYTKKMGKYSLENGRII